MVTEELCFHCLVDVVAGALIGGEPGDHCSHDLGWCAPATESERSALHHGAGRVDHPWLHVEGADAVMAVLDVQEAGDAVEGRLGRAVPHAPAAIACGCERVGVGDG